MSGMYDLHMHSLLSDGEMLPVEVIRRCAVLGYQTVAITDHVDASNIVPVIRAVTQARESAATYGVALLCGVELTHIPPTEIPGFARLSKAEGADIVVVHGETVMEPVAPGTNHAAVRCRDVDILAHPGLITEEDARMAGENGIALEITARAGHNRTNGHVCAVARLAGCRVVINSDAHSPADIMTDEVRISIARGAGMSESECREALALNVEEWLQGRR